MSTSYNAYLIFGVIVTDDDLTKRTLNPLWGKYKFDPETGKKVEQWDITDTTDAWSIADRAGVEYANFLEGETYHAVIGKVIAGVGSYDNRQVDVRELSDAEKAEVIETVRRAAADFGADLSKHEFKTQLIFEVS